MTGALTSPVPNPRVREDGRARRSAAPCRFFVDALLVIVFLQAGIISRELEFFKTTSVSTTSNFALCELDPDERAL